MPSYAEIVSDASLLAAYRQWAGDAATNALYFFVATSDEATLDPRAVANDYGPGGQYELDWSMTGDAKTYVETLRRLLAEADANPERGTRENEFADGGWYDGMLPVERRVITETVDYLRWAVGNAYSAYYDAFESYLAVSGAAPETAAAYDLDAVDWGAVQSLNQILLKDLDEGMSLRFWQSGPYLVLGEDQSNVMARMAIEQARGYANPTGGQANGTVRMESRGGVGSRGSITVSGSDDPDAFKATLRQFSSKGVDFE